MRPFSTLLNRIPVRVLIILFNSVVVLLLFLVVCVFLSRSLKSLSLQEKQKLLSQLNERAALTLGQIGVYTASPDNGSYEGVVKELSLHGDLSYVVMVNTAQSTTPHILFNPEDALRASVLFDHTPKKTEVYPRADKVHVISPITGYDLAGQEVALGFLISGFSLQSMYKEVRRTTLLIMSVSFALMLVGITLGVLQTRSLVIPLNRATTLIEQVTHGDFTQRMIRSSHDEAGELIHLLTTMGNTWKHTIEKTRAAIESYSSASHEISIAAHQQETIAAKEASSVSEITTTIEELNYSSHQVSEKAGLVTQRSREVLLILSDGQDAVRKSSEEAHAIQEEVQRIAANILTLSKGAQRIRKIADEVNSIANRTDMLAINADIEAARAGEQGRGFSVVATEVRNLADQIQKAAAKISLLTQKIHLSTKVTMAAAEQGTKGVEEGMKCILETSHLLGEVIASMGETVDAVQEITLSARQQSLGINQVAETMSTLNEGMRETATAATKTLKEALQLHSLSRELQGMIQSYKT